MRVATKRIIESVSSNTKSKPVSIDINWVFLLRVALTIINIFLIGYGVHWELNELYIEREIVSFGVMFIMAYAVLAISIIFYQIEKQLIKNQQETQQYVGRHKRR